MEYVNKEVYFCQWCHSCKHKDIPEGDEPCNECLENPSNEHSHKPVKYEAEKTKTKCESNVRRVCVSENKEVIKGECENGKEIQRND